MRFIVVAVVLTLTLGCKTQKGSNSSGNHLVNETSPYLLQHAMNPVDWYPWGEEALNKAKAEDKMLIISVGYAACHWCHVMEHESFEDSLVASIMNDNFVCIKVDKEERPDIDNVYMSACQLVSERGCGWPLNAFALPDGRPVWAGTYFPKEDWVNILEQFITMKNDDLPRLEESAEKLTKGINSFNEAAMVDVSDKAIDERLIEGLADQIMSLIDYEKGGKIGAPKFPLPNMYDFLLKYHHLTGNESALEAVKVTLDNMAKGGIYDHIGGGFARYSTDANWLVPHFEKMLYDNGQLLSLYSDAYKVTKNPLYKQVVEETVAFAQRELMDEPGLFYSSLDADSEGEEGKFYVWTYDEIQSIIKPQKSFDVFVDYYDVSKRGNWEGTTILNVDSSKDVLAKYDINQVELSTILKSGREMLMKARDSRIRPGTDDKVLTSWNGLMLTGLVSAYEAFGNEEYLDLAKANAKFFMEKMTDEDSRLSRNNKQGKVTINGFLDDYATLVNGLISLYQVTLDENYLLEADKYVTYAIEHFWNDSAGMFFYTSDIDAALIARKMELADNVIPGSNSMMARNLFYLGDYMYKSDYTEKAKTMCLKIMEEAGQSGAAFYTNWAQLYIDLAHQPYEVAVLGDNALGFVREMQKDYHPDVLFLGGKEEGDLVLLKDKLQEGQTTIYVCRNKVCKLPVTEVKEALKLIK